ncbi:hypothetical protein COU18_03105 [Candidatus Kaiserbacteria bacterium CG10_big_fil_rev_8_21_14_0_10_51_14]|uniref:Uncharacterized protein n=1 Tax=Candidatus Kaiserbacteria bacterium CG10_big_fil_rev_8_21_14_0_10_51_14 TaxID=1974610 RepID=A0A2H0UCY7_9BACT|nr:MAG: hypothetical protein COU18_03105 [Candidatus Kaiserbacteria bacterium CG10_big_fil_rev_8_21_14_0_10_51_14]
MRLNLQIGNLIYAENVVLLRPHEYSDENLPEERQMDRKAQYDQGFSLCLQKQVHQNTRKSEKVHQVHL